MNPSTLLAFLQLFSVCFCHFRSLVSSSSSSSSRSSSSSSRTDRWVHFQQSAGQRPFVNICIVHGTDDSYQLTRTFGGFSAQYLSKLFLKEFTVLLVTTLLGRALYVVVNSIG